MKTPVERVVLLHAGARPNSDEITNIARAVDQLGFDTTRLEISTHGCGDSAPNEGVAPFILVQLAREGKLAPDPLKRATIRTIGEGSERAILAIVARAAGPSPAPASPGAAPVPRPTGSQPPAKQQPAKQQRRGLFGRRGTRD